MGNRPCDYGHSSEKRDPSAYHADEAKRECTVEYIRPPDWCHANGDVASASELPAAFELPLRSVTMSTAVCSLCVLFLRAGRAASAANEAR